MKGRALDARSRLTPLLGTAMAGVAAGCLLLFAVFARQAILDVNPGLDVLPKAPATAVRQAITLLSPLQAARTEPPADEVVPAIPATAPSTESTSTDTEIGAPPTDEVTRSPSDARGFDLGALPIGNRLPRGVARQNSGETRESRSQALEKTRESRSQALEKTRESRSQAREKTRENRSQAHEKTRENRSQAHEKARENRSQAHEKARENRSQAHEKARENRSQAREKAREKGKSHRSKGRGRT